MLKKSGLSKVVNFSGIGKRRPDFLKRKKAMAVPIAIPIMTSTTAKATCRRVRGSPVRFPAQIQYVDDGQPKELNYNYEFK